MVAEAPNTVWKPTTIANWYGSGERMVRSLLRRPFGTPRACSPCPCAGSWSVIPKESSKPRPFYVPTSMPIRRRSSRWFVMRWQLEVTFQEVRRHLGFETQRQWSELAIRRTTPALLGLFSLVTLFAHQRMRRGSGCLSAPGGLVPQETSDLRRCTRHGA